MSKIGEKSIFTKLINFEIKLAQDGSTQDAVDLLKRVLKYLEEGRPIPDPLKDYFNSALRTIINGTDPNRAFLLVGIQGSDRGGIHKRYEIARLYRMYKNRGYSIDEIMNEIESLDYKISLRRAQEIHREFKEILDLEQE